MAILAAAVGLLALFISAFTAYVQRQQLRAQVWPCLQFDYSSSEHRLTWRNQGSGPAIVETVQVAAGDQALKDWRALRQALNLDSLNFRTSDINDRVLTTNQAIDWVQFENAQDFDRFMSAAKSRDLQFRICYCSTLGDCWTLNSKQPKQQESRSCPAVPETQAFQPSINAPFL